MKALRLFVILILFEELEYLHDLIKLQILHFGSLGLQIKLFYNNNDYDTI